MKIKAALLDFDGTVINSLPAVNGYFFSALERKGIIFTQKEKDALGGISINDIILWLKEEKNIHISHLEQKFHELYFWFFKMHTIRAFPGAIKLLEELKKEKIKIAIVSNSPRKYVKKVLEKNHLSQYFDVIVCVDDAGVPKPNPKMLGMAATQLHTSYKYCLMVDDNEPGIIAADTIGVRSILIGKGKKTIATKTVSKIEEIIKLIKK